MIKVMLWILLIVGVSYGCLGLYLYLRQRSFIYFPHLPTASDEAEVLWLEHDNQRIKIWTVKRSGGAALIYFGGNAEDVSLNLGFFKTVAPHYSLYLMNYRGYGGSSGTPTEASLYADSLALYDLICLYHDDIIVMGRSLGTGVATYLASQRPVHGVVLVTPYSSIAALASCYYPFMPVSRLLKDRYESDQRAPEISVPVLAMAAENDEIIPSRISDDLINSFKTGVVERVTVRGAGHNNIEQAPAYRAHLQRFLNSRSKPEAVEGI